MWITRKKHLCIVQELKYEIEGLRSDNAHIREMLKTAMELFDWVSRQNSELRYAPLHKIIRERLIHFWQNSELRYAPLHKIIRERLIHFWQNFKFF